MQYMFNLSVAFITDIVDPCQPNPCLNGGTCKASNDGKSFTCQCKPGWSGNKCQTSKSNHIRCNSHVMGVYLTKAKISILKGFSVKFLYTFIDKILLHIC